MMRLRGDVESSCSMSAICMRKGLAKRICVDQPDPANTVQRTDILLQDLAQGMFSTSGSQNYVTQV